MANLIDYNTLLSYKADHFCYVYLRYVVIVSCKVLIILSYVMLGGYCHNNS